MGEGGRLECRVVGGNKNTPGDDFLSAAAGAEHGFIGGVLYGTPLSTTQTATKLHGLVSARDVEWVAQM